MEGGVNANESENVADHADHEGETLRGKVASVLEGREDILGVTMGSEDDHGNKNREEAENVQNEDEALKLGERRADDGIDEDGKENDGPEEQSSLPRLRLVAGTNSHRDETLNHGSCEETRRGHRALPASDGQPTRDIAEELGARPRRQHSHPVILAAGRRCHGEQFGKSSEDAEVADPDNDETVDDGGGTAIDETLSGQDERRLPGNENGATETQNGHETKVSLWIVLVAQNPKYLQS